MNRFILQSVSADPGLFQYEPIAPAPNTILAIYQSPHSAQKLIGASPLQLRLELKDSGWKYLGSEGSGEDSKAASADQPLVSHEKETNVPAETQNTDQRSSTSENAGQLSVSLTAKDNAVQSVSGNKIWGSRGPSIEKAPLVQSLPQRKTVVIPDAKELSAQSSAPIQNAAPRTDRHGRSISDKYRDYKLEISPSNMDHQAYIARQWYYGSFSPDRKTIIGADLEGRVPLPGMFDCHVGKGEREFRVRIRMKEQGVFKSFSLKELYEKKISERSEAL